MRGIDAGVSQLIHTAINAGLPVIDLESNLLVCFRETQTFNGSEYYGSATVIYRNEGTRKYVHVFKDNDTGRLYFVKQEDLIKIVRDFSEVHGE